MTQLYDSLPIYQEGAPVTNLKKEKRGSITVEAALAIPLFLFAVLSLVFLLEVQAIHISLVSALQGASKMAAEEVAVMPVLNPIKLKADVVRFAGADRLDRSMIVGGSAGIHCGQSWYDVEQGIIHGELTYKVKTPFPGFAHVGMKKKETLEVRAWTGYEKTGIESEDDRIVYVTEHGRVYHTSYQCKHLQLSIRHVPIADIGNLRSEDGRKYYPCEGCVHSNVMGGVYVAQYGNRYHASLNCSALKRTIRAVKKRECTGMRECSSCGK